MWKWIIKKPSRLLTFWGVVLVALVTLLALGAMKWASITCDARWEAPTQYTWLAGCQVKTKLGWVQEERVRGF